jgi:hypothetical protein
MESKTGQNHDIFWRYFNALREHGEDVSIQIARFRGERPLEKLTFDHRTYDGISAVCSMVRSLPAEGLVVPRLQVSPAPSTVGKLKRLFLWWWRLLPALGKSWKKKSGLLYAPAAFVHLTPQQWTDVQARKGRGTSVVLTALDRVAQKHLTPSLLPRLWMIPVALYDKLQRETPPQNNVSFVDVRLTGASSPETVSYLLKRELTQGIYWGATWVLPSALLLGEKFYGLVLYVLPYFFRRTGTLTNLGAWSIPGLAADEWWALQAPVAALSPMATGMLETNGYLGLSVKFHAGLRWTASDAQAFAEELKLELLRE